MNAFDRLRLREKLKMIKLGGEYITTITLDHCTVSLYRIDNFLVEQHLDNQSKKTIRVCSVGYLEMIKYLPHITINSIYNLMS